MPGTIWKWEKNECNENLKEKYMRGGADHSSKKLFFVTKNVPTKNITLREAGATGSGKGYQSGIVTGIEVQTGGAAKRRRYFVLANATSHSCCNE